MNEIIARLADDQQHMRDALGEIQKQFPLYRLSNN